MASDLPKGVPTGPPRTDWVNAENFGSLGQKNTKLLAVKL